jgi:hypothetical protein
VGRTQLLKHRHNAHLPHGRLMSAMACSSRFNINHCGQQPKNRALHLTTMRQIGLGALQILLLIVPTASQQISTHANLVPVPTLFPNHDGSVIFACSRGTSWPLGGMRKVRPGVLAAGARRGIRSHRTATTTVLPFWVVLAANSRSARERSTSFPRSFPMIQTCERKYAPS